MADAGKVTDMFIQTLAQIVGVKNIITKRDDMESYCGDESPTSTPHYPEVVVKPDCTEEVSRVLALANAEKIPVTPRGAGTGVSGGAVPIKGGIVLSLERMNHIKEIDGDNFVVVAQPGVRLMDLCQAVEAQGGKVYRVTLIRDTSPTWWTDWRGEVVADVRGELSGYHQMPFPWMAVLGVAFVALLAYFLIRPTIESVTELIWGPGGGSFPWPIIVVGLVMLGGTFTGSRRSNE